MGFRGEALASIAAVAQVEMKTKTAEAETGTYIEIENSLVVKQEPVAMVKGTSIAMKNLFFNVPARRNFLKSNSWELKQIIEEFIRVAMAFPQIQFSLTSNGQQLYQLEKGNHKQRVLQVMGMQYNSKLITIQEKTDYLTIYGFTGKPDVAKKTRGDQYFFVNDRFIRSHYLHHAVMNAYQDLISTDSFPMYVLYIDLDPAQLDINVHPTKQEIKFEDEKIVYAFVQAAIKHALAQFSITPTLEFDIDVNIQHLDAVSQPFTPDKRAAASTSELFRNFSERHQAHVVNPYANTRHGMHNEPQEGAMPRFESLLDRLKTEETNAADPSEKGVLNRYESMPLQQKLELQLKDDLPLTQLHQCYIVTPTNRGFLLVHQQLAHERVLYERFTATSQGKSIATQPILFPITITLSQQDAVLMEELKDDLKSLGYWIESFGKDSFIIQGTPADLEAGNEKYTLENLLEQYKHFSSDLKFSRREKITRSLSWQHAIKAGKSLNQQEMKKLVEDLFNCTQPNLTAGGNPTFIEFRKEQLDQMFIR
jgi:DNA mismatch repair protein MutL